MQRLWLTAVLTLCLGGSALAQTQELVLDGRAWLDEYSAAADDWLTTAPQLPPAAESSEQLQVILAAPEFQTEAASQTPSWLERLWQRFLNWLQGLGVPSFGDGALGQWITVIAVCALIVLVVYLVVRLLRSFLNRARTESIDGLSGKQGPRSRDELLGAASEAAQRGDYASALRHRFKAMLALLDLPATAIAPRTPSSASVRA